MRSRYVPAGLLVLAIAAEFAPQAAQAEECILDETSDPNDIADGDGGASSGGTDSSLACGTGASTATLALQSTEIGAAAGVSAANGTAVGYDADVLMSQGSAFGALAKAIGAIRPRSVPQRR